MYGLLCAIVQLLLSYVADAVSPVVFPPSENWDGDDGPWSTFSIRLGNPEQVVRVLPSTSGYNVIVPLPGACNTTSDYNGCVTARAGVFDPSGSKTWQDQGLFGVGMQANLGYGTVNGDFGLDKVGLGIVVNPNVTFADQVIGGIVADEFYVGLFGLGTQPTNFTDTSDPHTSFFTSLKTSNNTPSYTWSYTAGAQYENTGALGSMIFGGYDASLFTPNSLTIPMSPDVSRDLVVGLQSITATYSAGSKLLLPSGGIFSFVDSTLPYIWLPVDACLAFENAFGLVWDEKTELYLVNDTLHASLSKLNPTFTFTIGVSKAGGQTVDLDLSYASFDLQAKPPLVSNATRYFPLKRAANDTQYTLGRAFLQETYLIADYERNNFSLSQCTFVAGAPSKIVTIESIADATSSADGSSTTSGGSSSGSGGTSNKSSSKSGISGGAIGGIVVAAVVIIAGVFGLLFFLRKKRRWPFNLPPVELDGSDSDSPAANTGGDGQPDYSTDPAAEPMHPKPDAAEAMSSPLIEMQDVHPVAGYFAKGARTHEMPASEPAVGELASPDGVHEMFDESVYREMHDDTHSQVRTSPSSRATPNMVQPFSWMDTPQSAISVPVSGHETYDSSLSHGTRQDEITTISRTETPDQR